MSAWLSYIEAITNNHIKVCMSLQDLGSLDCERSLIDYGNEFPHAFRALVEILPRFESTNLASRNFSEAVCKLNNIVQPDLNTTVSYIVIILIKTTFSLEF